MLIIERLGVVHRIGRTQGVQLWQSLIVSVSNRRLSPTPEKCLYETKNRLG